VDPQGVEEALVADIGSSLKGGKSIQVRKDVDPRSRPSTPCERKWKALNDLMNSTNWYSSRLRERAFNREGPTEYEHRACMRED
jgi:hypothetical protein